MCTTARSQNNVLRNPSLRITPLPAFDPIQGIILHPHVNLFPRHANEFYSLRHPSDHEHRKCAYNAA